MSIQATLKKTIGLRWIEEGGRFWRFTWAEISFGRLGFALDYTAGQKYDDRRAHVHIHLPFINAFFYVPWRHESDSNNMIGRPSWGFYYMDKALVLKYGKKTKFIHMPWAWEHLRHDILMADGTWKRVAKGMGEDGMPWNWKDKWQATHDYHYCLKNWTIQERKATIGVSEREWRIRTLMWLPFPRIVRRVIDVEFSDEVGERSGSWKGGTTGCGYDLRKNETPLECLRRMERERKF